MRSLRAQGLSVLAGEVAPSQELDKKRLRELHSVAVTHRIERSKDSLCRYEPELLDRIASGPEVKHDLIFPRLVEVRRNSMDELLFRYATLHWSIPVSSGYGRRLRFLLIDEQNDKLIGLLGLGDPVFSLAARDDWIGWDKEIRRDRLHHVVDAFVLGAVPPYSFLLCGKLIAMLATSNEVREAFKRKYDADHSIIQNKPRDGRLALMTTISALGRSSIYNRLRYGERLLYYDVGLTRGWGEFHFSDGIYGAISQYAMRYCKPTAKKEGWGTGFRNRREVVRKCLADVGLPERLLYHGIRRQIFVIPLAQNAREFLQGQHSDLLWFDQPFRDLFNFFRERWLIPRSRRDQRHRTWDRSEWQIWSVKQQS